MIYFDSSPVTSRQYVVKIRLPGAASRSWVAHWLEADEGDAAATASGGASPLPSESCSWSSYASASGSKHLLLQEAPRNFSMSVMLASSHAPLGFFTGRKPQAATCLHSKTYQQLFWAKESPLENQTWQETVDVQCSTCLENQVFPSNSKQTLLQFWQHKHPAKHFARAQVRTGI